MFQLVWKCHSIAAIFVLVAAVAESLPAKAAGQIDGDAYDRCRAISDDKARLACFESLTAPPREVARPAPAPPSPSQGIPDLPSEIFGSQAAPASRPIGGKWRLVHAANPRDGHPLVSIMATGELSGSDVDFAGLDLRCDGEDFDVLVFLIRPLLPRAHPTISLNGRIFEGSVLSPGTAIQLPKTVTVLAREQWPALPSLLIEVDDNGTRTHGVVSLEGFAAALPTLAAACLTK
jgi:hypothetical protein